MLRNTTSDTIWTTMEQSYTLQYELLYSQNTEFEEYDLWEYGIRCILFDENHNVMSQADVKHITKDKEIAMDMVMLMVKHKVFPVHLYDVVSDELMKSLDYCYC